MKNSFRLGLSSLERKIVTSVVITASVKDELYSGFATAAGEACGALFGDLSGTALRITRLHACTNAAVLGHEFAIGFDELVSICDPYRERLIGIFHFHPDSEPVPSRLDLPFLALSPLVWGIVGRPGLTRNVTVQFFVWAGAGLKEMIVSQPLSNAILR